MSRKLPGQLIDCPDPDNCPVPETIDGIELVVMAEGRYLYRVYDSTWGYDEFNPGFGDARFSPFDAVDGSGRVPAMYLANSETAAMLESVFHELHQDASRSIYARDLRRHLLAHLRIPFSAVLIDLRDAALTRYGLARDQLVSTTAEHYPCTRRLGRTLLDTHAPTVRGLIWHSRQTELADLPPAEVVVLFGGGRYPDGRGAWHRVGPGSRNLYEGPGRLLVDEVAELLDAVVQPE